MSSDFSRGVSSTATQLETQLRNPTNVISVLLIVASDIVGAALDNLSGPAFVPVVFSFGWVSYAHKAFVKGVGLGGWLSSGSGGGDVEDVKGRGSGVYHGADEVVEVEVPSGRRKKCRDRTLGRVVREWGYWKPREVEEDEADGEDAVNETVKRKLSKRAASSSSVRQQHGRPSGKAHDHSGDGDSSTEDEGDDPFDALHHPLRITVFTAHSPGVFTHDKLWYMGIACALIQLGIASIPLGLHGDWSILLVTGIGTVLALITGTLPHFGTGGEYWRKRRERDCGVRGKRTIALARGELADAREVLVIRDLPVSADVDELLPADGEDMDPELQTTALKLQRRHAQQRHEGVFGPLPWLRLATAALATCWIILLIIVSGLRSSSWYLIGIGFLGMLQNGFVAASPRTPGARGLHLEFGGSVSRSDAGRALIEVDDRLDGVGKALLRNICSDASREDCKQWWRRHGRRGQDVEIQTRQDARINQ